MVLTTYRQSSSPAGTAEADLIEVDYASLKPRKPVCRAKISSAKRDYIMTVAPDGGWGWFVLLAAHSTLIFREGIAKCLGVFLPTFRDVFETSTSMIGWISSLCITFADFTGLISGPLCQRFGCRPVAIIGGVFAGSGLVAAAYGARSMMHLSWSLSFAGIGLGLALTPSLTMISRYFDKRYSMANGLAYSGSGVGILTLAPLSQLLIDCYGWRGALSVIGAMTFNVAVCGALLRPLHLSTGMKGQGRRYQRLPSNNDDTNSIDSSNDIDDDVTPGGGGVSGDSESGGGCCKFKGEILALSLFKDPSFLLLMVVQVCGRFAYMGWLVYLIPHAIEKGITPMGATLLASIAGITNIFSRALHGILVDRKILTATHLLTIAAVVAAGSLIVDPLLKTFATLTIASLTYGLASGVYFPISVVVVKNAVGVEKFANALGWSYGFAGIGRMLAGFITGWLFDQYGSYDVSFIVLGLVQSVAVFLMLIICCVEYHRKRRQL
ncbi:monocarboxylate transporter 13-like [Asterias amurensis]|uniref:monocarboxylate transporter 13-like n=1 Tax=Asterias amurensis TaxID=7602 RepID=UPI003AB29948